MILKIRIHLNSGNVIEYSIDSEEEAEDEVKLLHEAITDLGKPSWFLLDSTLIFTGAVSAIEVI